MKNKSKLLLLSLISLSMVGCSGSTDSSTSSKATDSAPIAESSKTSTSSSTSSSSSSSSPISSSKETSSSSDSSSSSSSSSVDDQSSSWKGDVATMMKKYLGGQLIPYINLGRASSLFVEWDNTADDDYGHLVISSGKAVSADFVSDVKTFYQDCGWSIDTASTTTKMIATLDSAHLKVELGPDELSDTVFSIKITYNEPYDKSKFTTYDTETLTAINDRFSTTIPVIYLATTHPELDTSDGKFILTGGQWNDNVITDATAAFRAVNWNVTENASDSTTIKATYTDPTNNNVITAEIKKELKQVTSSLYVARMSISLKEGWNPSGFTAWPQDILDDFNESLDNHTIPVIYLGTNFPTSTNSAQYNNYYVDVRGGEWNDEVITSTKTTLETANSNTTKTGYETDWSIQTDTTGGSDNTYVNASKKFSDGCTVTLKIKKNTSDNTITMHIDYAQSFVQTATAWSSDTTEKMKQYLDNHTLPFFWYGTDTLSVDKVTYPYSGIKFTGTTWNNEMKTNFENAYTAANWTELTDSEKNNYRRILNYAYSTSALLGYKITMDDGCELIVAMEDLTSMTRAVTSTFYCFITSPFNPSAATSWSNEVTSQFEQYYPYTVTGDDGTTQNKYYSIPFFYTGTKNPTASYSEYGNPAYLEITGGDWNDQIWNLATEGLNKTEVDENGLTWTSSTETDSSNNITKVTSTSSENKDGKYFKVEVSKEYNYNTYTNYCKVKVYYFESYNAENWTSKTWTSDTKKAMKTALGDHVIPAFYMGTKAETYSSSDNSITITGGYWNKQTVSNLRTALSSDTSNDDEVNTEGTYEWHIEDYYNNNTNCLRAYKTLNDGSHLRLWLEPTTSGEYGKAQLKVYFDAAITAGATTAWDEDTVTKIKEALGDSNADAIPYINMNNGTVTASVTTSDDKVKYISFTSSKSSNQTMWDLNDALTSASWNVDFVKLYSTYNSKLTATKEVSNGTLYLSMTSSNSFSVTLLPSYTKAANFEDSSSNWSDDILTLQRTYLGTALPYFDLGSATCTWTPSSNYQMNSISLTAKNAAYSSDMYDDIKTVFTTAGFACTYSYETSKTTLLASKTLENGKHITVEIYTTLANYSGATTNLKAYVL